MYFSSLRSWCVQRVANLGLAAVVLLMVVAFWYDRPSHKNDDDGASKRPDGRKQRHRHHRDEMTTSQLVFVYYTLTVHVLGLLFPMRLVWATRSMIQNLRKTLVHSSTLELISKGSSTQHSKLGGNDSIYEDSVSSADCSGSESEIELSSSTASEWEDEPLLHAIIIPNYKEEVDTLRETLDIFASHVQARSSYEVCSVPCEHERSTYLIWLPDLPRNGARGIGLRCQSGSPN
jgi:hypothetical protein